jgi:DNA-binding NarL/FixJ family response regulator
MASISLISNSIAAGYGNNSSTRQTQQPDTSSASATEDTVKLSDQAQAKLMYKQGQSVTSIASQLGTTAKTVDSYLGIALQKELQQVLQTAESAG